MAQKRIPKGGIKINDIWISVLCPNEWCRNQRNERHQFRVHAKQHRTTRNCPYCLKSTAIVDIDWESRRGWLLVEAATIDEHQHMEIQYLSEDDIDFDTGENGLIE